MPIPNRQSGGLSLKQWTLVFFGAVIVCAIFFAMGYVVGSGGRKTVAASPAVEQVPPASEIPEPINPPLKDAASTQPSHAAPQSATVIEQNLPSPSREPASRPAAAREQRSGQRVMIQVAALRAKPDAQSLLRLLKSHGYHALLLTPREAGARDGLYRVQVGPFASRDQAIKSLQRLSSQGFRPFIKE